MKNHTPIIVAVLILLLCIPMAQAAFDPSTENPARSPPSEDAFAYCSDGMLRAATPDCAEWISRYDDQDGPDSFSLAQSVAMSPDSSTVFITGGEGGDSPEGAPRHAITVAMDASNGQEIWTARFDADQGLESFSIKAINSSDGSTVYMTGWAEDPSDGLAKFLLVAYGAETGHELWRIRIGDADETASVADAALSPDGSRLVLTGRSGWGPKSDFFTALVDLDGRDTLWTQRYDSGGTDGLDIARSIGFSPAGETIYVTGSTQRIFSGPWNYTTIAFSADTGSMQWVSQYARVDGGSSSPSGIVVGPLGERVYVTGETFGPSLGDTEAVTVAYDANSGAELWQQRFSADGALDGAKDLVLSPQGDRLFVVAYSRQEEVPVFTMAGEMNHVTIAYDARTGEEIWRTRHESTSAIPWAIDITEDGSHLIIAGQEQGGWTEGGFVERFYRTIAIDPLDGSETWNAKYAGDGTGRHIPNDMMISPDGSRVVVTGGSEAADGRPGIATLAYPIDRTESIQLP